MKVFSQIAREGEPRYLQAIQGNYWFSLRGYEVVDFTYDELLAGALDDALSTPESTIVFAAVSVVREAVFRAGRNAPPNLDFPPELSGYLHREVGETTMAEIRKWERDHNEKLPVHIKPRDHPKLFTGTVISAFRDLIPLSHVDSAEPLIWQQTVRMQSEWRASILRDRVINVAHYKGDPLQFPDTTVINQAISRFKSAPIGYAMDWAVTDTGDTILAEVNDGFSLGNYGVPGHLYTALIEARWRQLMGLPDNDVGMS